MSPKKATPKPSLEHNYSRSKRRIKSPVKRKMFVYISDEEHAILANAADRQRISISGFLAKAGLDSALAEEATLSSSKKR